VFAVRLIQGGGVVGITAGIYLALFPPPARFAYLPVWRWLGWEIPLGPRASIPVAPLVWLVAAFVVSIGWVWLISATHARLRDSR
jgi:hypothetical protein